MAGSSQPKHFFVAGYVFADFAIAVILYPVIHVIGCPSSLVSNTKQIYGKDLFEHFKTLSQCRNKQTLS